MPPFFELGYALSHLMPEGPKGVDPQIQLLGQHLEGVFFVTDNREISDIEGLFDRKFDAMEDGIGGDGLVIPAAGAATGEFLGAVEILLVSAFATLKTLLPLQGLEKAITGQGIEVEGAKLGIVHVFFHEPFIQHFFNAVLQLPVVQVEHGIDLIDLERLPLQLYVGFLELVVFLVQLQGSFLHLLLELTGDLVFELHVYLVLMDDAFQGTVAHVFQDANAVAKGERKEQHLEHEAEMQAVVQGSGKREDIEIDERPDEKAEKQDAIGDDKKSCGAVATVPHLNSSIEDQRQGYDLDVPVGQHLGQEENLDDKPGRPHDDHPLERTVQPGRVGPGAQEAPGEHETP